MTLGPVQPLKVLLPVQCAAATTRQFLNNFIQRAPLHFPPALDPANDTADPAIEGTVLGCMVTLHLIIMIITAITINSPY